MNQTVASRAHHLRRKLQVKGSGKPGELISRFNDLKSGKAKLKHRKHPKTGPETDKGSVNGKSPDSENQKVGTPTKLFEKHHKMACKTCGKHHAKGYKHHKAHAPKGPHGRAAVHALGRTKTTGNFAKIEAAKGKAAAIGAYQNKLAAHQGRPAPYHRKGKN